MYVRSTSPSPSVPFQCDVDLVRSALLGDAVARDRFARRMSCVARILGRLNRRFGGIFHTDELEDLEQDVFTTVWCKLNDYAGTAALECWVSRFCELATRSALRKRARHRRVEEWREVHEPVLDDDASRPVLDTDTVQSLLARVPSSERQLLHLKHFGWMTFEQIGRRLAISSNTAKTRYYRALEHLRKNLDRARRI